MSKQKGFTLIEILIYSALTTLIAAFALVSVYAMISYADRSRYLRELVENQKMLEQKIYWVLQNNSAINTPQSGATSTVLSVNKLSYASNPVVLDTLASTTARIKLGSAEANMITTEFIEIQDLSFRRTDVSGQPVMRVYGRLFEPHTSSTVEIMTSIPVK